MYKVTTDLENHKIGRSLGFSMLKLLAELKEMGKDNIPYYFNLVPEADRLGVAKRRLAEYSVE